MNDKQSAENTIDFSSENCKSSNNKTNSGCLSSNCVSFPKSVYTDNEIESSTSHETFLSQSCIMSNQTEDDKNLKKSLNEENATTNKKQIAIGDKCPSRWLPNTSDQQKRAVDSYRTEMSNFDVFGDIKHYMRSDIGGEPDNNQNLLGTKSEQIICKSTIKDCDPKQFGKIDNKECDNECKMMSQETEDLSDGIEREICGKEAIEKLATELNKAATTIQDFSQNVRNASKLRLFIVFNS